MKRQHPIVIVTGFFNELRSLLLPIGISFLVQLTGQNGFGVSPGYLIFMGGVLVFLLVFGFIRWIFFRYEYDNGSLHIKKGVLIKKDRTIKKDRIQTINTEAGIILRMFSLVSLHIETAASSGESEFHISALPKEEAERLKKRLAQDMGATDTPNGDSNGPDLELGFDRLFVAGVTSGSVGLIFGALGIIFSQLLAVIPETVMEVIVDSIVATSLIGIIIVLAFLFLLSWVLSTFRFLIRFAFFTVKHEGDRLKISRGLIVRKEFTVQFHRIQSIYIEEGVLRQPFSLASIQAEVAGGSEYEDAFRISLIPIIPIRDVQRFLSRFIPEYAVEHTLDPLPKRSLRRYLIRAAIPFVFLIPLLFFWFYTIALFLLMIPALFLGWLRYKDGGHCMDRNHLVIRSRLLARKTTLTKKPHIQSMLLNRSVLQRFRRLCTLQISVLSANRSATYTLKDLSYEDFFALYTWFGPEKALES